MYTVSIRARTMGTTITPPHIRTTATVTGSPTTEIITGIEVTTTDMIVTTGAGITTTIEVLWSTRSHQADNSVILRASQNQLGKAPSQGESRHFGPLDGA